MTRRPSVLALASLGCAIAAAAVWAIGFHVPTFSRADSAVMDGFHGLERPRTVGPAQTVAGLMDPLPFALLGAILTIVGALRGGARLALAVAAILVGANVTTQALKPLLEAWSTGHEPASTPVPPGSWPSGHTTAAMSLALCLVLVVPERRRPVVAAAGGLVVVAVVFSILVLAWHYPSDVVGGFFVAAVWGLAALAALGPARVAETAPQRGVALGAGAVLARPDQVIAYAQAHSAFVVGAAAVAAAGLAVAAGVAALARG